MKNLLSGLRSTTICRSFARTIQTQKGASVNVDYRVNSADT